MGINILDSATIDKIAAGEVVERPVSVVKELVENSIDAGADMITVEIKNGGISFIRVTDNGCGIPKEEVKKAFLRHATSKISKVEDLLSITSLGFRGEALSSISAVSDVELITKTGDSLIGTRVCINTGEEPEITSIGAPNGTTIVVRNLFKNIPVRRKFLRTDKTEGSYIAERLEELSLSHPDISFTFISNNDTKLHTSGNGNLKEVIYRIHGRDISESLIPVSCQSCGYSLSGFLGKPEINRSSRNYELFYVNGRLVKDRVLSRMAEDAYRPYLMQHKFPFLVLNLDLSPDEIDVNVHPSKLEIRFISPETVYDFVTNSISEAFRKKELIREEAKESARLPQKHESAPEPFEISRLIDKIKDTGKKPTLVETDTSDDFFFTTDNTGKDKIKEDIKPPVSYEEKEEEKPVYIQETFITPEFLSEKASKNHRILGQIFDTYWLVAYEDKLYLIDQHAAHEKVKYERLIKHFAKKEFPSQNLYPPIVLTLSLRAMETFKEYREYFFSMGFEAEEIGGRDIALRSVPLDLYGQNEKEMFLNVLDELSDGKVKGTSEFILDKIASMSCKAAVKGNTKMTENEARALIEELLTLENPYNCPHGRPTIISMSKYDIEKKFKRIV